MEEVRAALERLLPAGPLELQPVGGGDIGESFRARTASGTAFVKRYRGPQAPRMVTAEAEGLAWLSEAGALRVPEVVGVATGEDGGPSLLVLEWIEEGDPRPGTGEALGRGLAALHAASPGAFGLDRDNFIGRLPQSNAPAADWAGFYRDRRLAPLIERARAEGLLEAREVAMADRLLARLPGLVGPEEAPARLHGDLWGGNWLCDARGDPVLFDPAVYGGHREVDLAMMKLFGGFPDRVFDAYAEAAPLAPDWRERVDLYQLLPLLVHLNLFGRSYAGGVVRAMRAYL